MQYINLIGEILEIWFVDPTKDKWIYGAVLIALVDNLDSEHLSSCLDSGPVNVRLRSSAKPVVETQIGVSVSIQITF